MTSPVLDYIVERARQPFVWGKTDCVQFAAGMIERLTGVMPQLPEYSSESEAKRVLVSLGGLEAAVSKWLGPAQRDLRLCGDGDIVLTAFGGQQSLGVYFSRVVFVMRQQDGCRFDPTVIPVDVETAAIRWWPCRSS